MKIRLKENHIVNIDAVSFTKRTKRVSCWQTNCMDLNIGCKDCVLYPRLTIAIDEVLVKE